MDQPQPQQPQQQQGGGGIMQMLSRILFMYMAVQFLSKQFAANKEAPPLQDAQNFERPSAVQQLLGMDPAATIPKFATHDADGNRLPPHRPVFSRNARVVRACWGNWLCASKQKEMM
jgi:hypothetical protein